MPQLNVRDQDGFICLTQPDPTDALSARTLRKQRAVKKSPDSLKFLSHLRRNVAAKSIQFSFILFNYQFTTKTCQDTLHSKVKTEL